MKQLVWRTLSESNNSGFFVWDVIEVIGETNRPDYSLPKGFTKCIDDSYVLIYCSHFWTKEKAIKFMFDNEYCDFQSLYIISGMPELTASEYKEWLKS